MLVNDNPQPPARQRPVAQALDNVGSPVVAEYAGRSAGVRGLAGTHSRWHTEAVKEKGKCLYTRKDIERDKRRVANTAERASETGTVGARSHPSLHE